MRFLVSFKECCSVTEAERKPMLRRRTEAFDYWRKLSNSDEVVWSFASDDLTMTICLMETRTLEYLDAKVKRSPLFPHANVNCIPTISSDAVAREILASLNNSPVVVSSVSTSDQADRPVEADREYWLVYKSCPPFRPTDSDERLRDVLERTVVAKRTFDSTVEFADLNVVGQMAAYLIGVGPRETVEHYVSGCAVGDGIEWDITPLIPLERAFARSVDSESTVAPYSVWSRDDPKVAFYDGTC